MSAQGVPARSIGQITGEIAMKRLVLAVCLLQALLATGAMAGEADRFVGHWTAKQDGQTISWDIAAGNTATFYKDGVIAGDAPWVLNADGTLSIKAPPGDFVAKLGPSGKMEITPPAAFNSPPSLFQKE
jgi:hypothetical protein